MVKSGAALLLPRSYYYEYHPAYGSPQMDVRTPGSPAMRLSPDRKMVMLTLGALEPGRIYELTMGDLRANNGQKKLFNRLVCYTLNQLRQ